MSNERRRWMQTTLRSQARGNRLSMKVLILVVKFSAVCLLALSCSPAAYAQNPCPDGHQGFWGGRTMSAVNPVLPDYELCPQTLTIPRGRKFIGFTLIENYW